MCYGVADRWTVTSHTPPLKRIGDPPRAAGPSSPPATQLDRIDAVIRERETERIWRTIIDSSTGS